MKSIIKKPFLLACAFVLTTQFSFGQKKHKDKTKKHSIVSINHQGKDTDISQGFWSVEQNDYGTIFQLSSTKGSQFSFKRDSFFIAFYLSEAELNSIKGATSNFSINRAAGTLVCQGDFQNERSQGTFKFNINNGFRSFLNDEGITDGTSYDYVKLFLGDVDKAYVAGIKNEGYTPTLKQLGKLGALDVSLAYVEAINNTQYKGLDLDMLTKFAIHGVSPNYIDGLKDLGYSSMDANMVKKFAIHGVSLDYMKGLQDVGYTQLDPNMIKKFAIHGVSLDYIEGLNALGYKDLDPNVIKNFAIHGVSLNYIESLIALDINRPSVSEIKKAKIHGVSANFVERARRKGHNEKDLSDFVKLKIHGL